MTTATANDIDAAQVGVARAAVIAVKFNDRFAFRAVADFALTFPLISTAIALVADRAGMSHAMTACAQVFEIVNVVVVFPFVSNMVHMACFRANAAVLTMEVGQLPHVVINGFRGTD